MWLPRSTTTTAVGTFTVRRPHGECACEPADLEFAPFLGGPSPRPRSFISPRRLELTISLSKGVRRRLLRAHGKHFGHKCGAAPLHGDCLCGEATSSGPIR